MKSFQIPKNCSKSKELPGKTEPIHEFMHVDSECTFLNLDKCSAVS